MKTIFLIDDSATMLMSLRQTLEMSGYKVEVAGDGAQALEKLKKIQKPDLIITDINMPNMNGFGLLEAIKKDEKLKSTPVLMITAEASKDDVLMAAKFGASGYIVKPFSKAILEEKIHKLFKRKAK